MTGTRSIDQMVEAAIWLMVQGDRAGAEDLLAQALRIDPSHERARQAMKSVGATTRPGEQPPQRNPNDAFNKPVTEPGLPPVDFRSTPLEPQPALQRPAVPPRTTHPHGLKVDDWDRAGDTTLPGARELPFTNTPSAVNHPTPRDERHQGPTPSTVTQPRFEAPTSPTMPIPVMGKAWSLEVLTGPHQGTSLSVGRRPVLIGRGLGLLNDDGDLFMSPGHASFFLRGPELWISDGGSASGTWVSVDGPTRLSPGDSFSVGLQRLRYLGPLDSAPAEQPWPYGAPRPASSWRLEHVLVGARPGRTWVLRGVVTVGGEGSAVKFTDDTSLAPVHAELRPAGPSLELVDRSGGQSFIMLTPGAERRLPEGCLVRLGSTVLRIAAR